MILFGHKWDLAAQIGVLTFFEILDLVLLRLRVPKGCGLDLKYKWPFMDGYCLLGAMLLALVIM